MLTTSKSQANPLERNPSVPVDGCCLVVQMPSVDEMRREVADITCQMQSVYLDDDEDDNIEDDTKPDNAEEMAQVGLRKYSVGNNSLHSSPKKKMTTLGPCSPLSERTSVLGEFGPSKAKSNSIGRVAGISNEMVEAFPIQTSMSSSLPREEEVSEEFVINGKRYRQTYQRRVVLERKTTRDVFFLPASSGETKNMSTGEKTLEYRSPSFNKPGLGNASIESHLSNNMEPEIDARPRLDLTVLHNPSGPNDDTSCLTPAVIMRPIKSSPEKKSSDQLSADQNKDQSTQSLTDHPITTSSSFHTDFERSKNHNIPKRSKSKYLVREFVDTVRKQMTTNLRRTKSILTPREEKQLQRTRISTNRVLESMDHISLLPVTQVDTGDERKGENKERHECKFNGRSGDALITRNGGRDKQY